MAEGFLHKEKDGLFVWRTGVQDAIGRETGAGEAWCKDVVVEGAPEDRTVGASQDACRKEGSCCGTGVAAAGDFVQGGPGQAIFGQTSVYFLHTEGEDSSGARAETLEGADAGA